MESTHRTRRPARRRALRLVLAAAALVIWLATPLAFIPRFRSAPAPARSVVGRSPRRLRPGLRRILRHRPDLRLRGGGADHADRRDLDPAAAVKAGCRASENGPHVNFDR
jgi:hypothetical protein